MKTTVSRLALLSAALVAALSGCGGSSPDTSAVKFDSAHSIAIDGVIDNGRIVTDYDYDDYIKDEISEQLFYTIGQLNGVGGVADMSKLESSIISKTQRADGKFDVEYAAKLFISWPREVAIPANMQLVMPAQGNYEGLDAFYVAYGSDEATTKKCMAPEAHEVEMGIFWYYYRPAKGSCGLRNPSADDVNLVARFNIRLGVSTENTGNKYPEYAKVWEDGKLVVTNVFGKYEVGATELSDAGISAYRDMYYSLRNTFGTPVSDSLQGQQPDAAHSEAHLIFNVQTAQGVRQMDVDLFLVDEIRSVDQAFRDAYNERTKTSDFVSYSGHSGLGANIRALTRMGTFLPGQYQIFLVNGCDTFAYVEDSLRQAHAAANPGAGPDKYFDMITNAMPSFFHNFAGSNVAIMRGLIGQQRTYRQILQGLDVNQRANVTGEQDNAWPNAF